MKGLSASVISQAGSSDWFSHATLATKMCCLVNQKLASKLQFDA